MATDESQSPKSEPKPPDAAPVEGGLSSAPSSWDLFLDAHHKKLLIAAGAVAVAVILGVIIQNRAQARSDAAATAFTSATTIAEFEAVSEDHRGTPAAGNALLMKADLELKEGKLTESQATLTSFIASYPDHPLYFQGLFALGVQANEKGDLDEAESYFRQVIDDANAIDLAPLAVIHSGDIACERGKIDEARDLYESVNPTYPGTPYGVIAQQRLRREAFLPPAPKPVPVPVPVPAAAPPVSATTTPVPAPASATTAPVAAPAPAVKAGASATEKPEATPKPATKPAAEKAKQKGKKVAPVAAPEKAGATPTAEKPSESSE